MKETPAYEIPDEQDQPQKQQNEDDEAVQQQDSDYEADAYDESGK